MIESLRRIPIPLQHQIIIRAAIGIIALIAGALTLCLWSITIAMPFLLLMFLLEANAVHIYRVAIHGCFLKLTGTVLKTERTILRQRPKAALLEVEGKALRVLLHNRSRALRDGDRVLLFVADDTPLMERRGLYQIDSYLALVIEGGCKRD